MKLRQLKTLTIKAAPEDIDAEVRDALAALGTDRETEYLSSEMAVAPDGEVVVTIFYA
jgi:hypothetical protein